MTLSGNYTGATSVAAGRLSVNGVLGTSPIAVLAAAELGGSGSIGGPVSVSNGDDVQLQMIVTNLLTNAVEAIAAGDSSRRERCDAVQAAYLLGSAATDRLRADSDIDVAILPSRRAGLAVEERLALTAELARVFGRPVPVRDAGFVDVRVVAGGAAGGAPGLCCLTTSC